MREISLLEMSCGYSSASWWALSVDLTDWTLGWEENTEHEERSGDLGHGSGEKVTGSGSNWVSSETKLSCLPTSNPKQLVYNELFKLTVMGMESKMPLDPPGEDQLLRVKGHQLLELGFPLRVSSRRNDFRLL